MLMQPMPMPTTLLSFSTTPSAMTMVPKAGGPLVPGPGRISINAA